MERLKEKNLVLGCGERGMDWRPRIFNDALVIPFDHKEFSYPQENFVVGDALALPFACSSIDRVYSDFVLNAVEMRSATMKDITDRPEILEDRSCPEPVRDWFINVLGRSAQKFERNQETLRWILREIVLREMWRVVKEGGSITIVDHGHIINWLRAKKLQIFHGDSEGIELRMPHLTDEDFRRSASLEKLSKNGAKVGKTVIRKVPAQLPLSFHEIIQEQAFGSVYPY